MKHSHLFCTCKSRPSLIWKIDFILKNGVTCISKAWWLWVQHDGKSGEHASGYPLRSNLGPLWIWASSTSQLFDTKVSILYLIISPPGIGGGGTISKPNTVQSPHTHGWALANSHIHRFVCRNLNSFGFFLYFWRFLFVIPGFLHLLFSRENVYTIFWGSLNFFH